MSMTGGTAAVWQYQIDKGRRRTRNHAERDIYGGVLAAVRRQPPIGASPQATLLVPQTALPRYDPRRRELWFLGLLVKKFRHPSPNQECLLKAFDEENWATAIFDPLPQKGETLPSKRLGDTLEALNSHHQSLGLLRFESRGGQLACWLPGPVAIASHAWPHAPKGARLAVVSA